MVTKYDRLREELHILGYHQKLHPDCIPLVEKLLADLNVTTTNLQKYMKISQQVLEEKELLELGAEPYKCDNARLIKAANDVEVEFIRYKEQQEKIRKDLKTQVVSLQNYLDNCNLEKKELISQVQELTREKKTRFSRSESLKPAGKQTNKIINRPSSITTKKDETEIELLKTELKKCKEKQSKLEEETKSLKNQVTNVSNRDKEIRRLQILMEQASPFDTDNKECCYKKIHDQITPLQNEIAALRKEKNDLQTELKDALAKQHEAMRRALHLLERNRQLEKEMKDIDEIAIAVETDRNNTVKNNTEKISRLQDRINESVLLIQNLESQNSKLNQTKLKLAADLDAVKLEKNHLQKQLDIELECKTRIKERLRNLNLIENDLSKEIDRLSKLNADQKLKIVVLESQLKDNDGHNSDKDMGIIGLADEPKMPANKSSTAKQKKSVKKTTRFDSSSLNENSCPGNIALKKNQIEPLSRCCCESGTCVKNLKELLDKEIEYRQANTIQSIQSLKEEKEYYMKEYHRLLGNVQGSDRLPPLDRPGNETELLKQQLVEKENIIKELQQLENTKSFQPDVQTTQNSNGVCTNLSCRRKDRELEIQKKHIEQTEIEINMLKSKLQSANETTVFNEDRVKKAFDEMEEHVKKLEDERLALVKTDLTQKTNIAYLEEELKVTKEHLQQTQNELTNQRASYNQIKMLHEHTDKALAEAQTRLLQAETEMSKYQTKMKDTSKGTVLQDKEIARLNADLQVMKTQLNQVEKENGELLGNLAEKVEKIEYLEEELKDRNRVLSNLENELREIRKKLSKYVDESSNQDQVVRAKQKELTFLEQDFSKERRLKDAALLENKKLQDDLISVTCDCRNARKELELSKRQVDDLKRQLQHYVAEVKRTEDLISQKELQRTELLDQFKCLSQEANILENNNHTLETEATQSKIQLSVALDHSSELERKIEYQESIINSYEKQISDLTAHVASLEVQMKQHQIAQDHYMNELKQLRDLCIKLDKDKDNLKRELQDKHERQTEEQKSSQKLLLEKRNIEEAWEKERNNLKAVERLLNDSRQEAIDQRLLNEDLQNEIENLKQRVAELEFRM